MKLLVTGNSHTVSLRDAWNRIGERHPDIDVAFFAAPNRVFDTFRVDRESGEFGLPRDTDPSTIQYKATVQLNDRPRVALGDFDRVVVAGVHFTIRFLLQLLLIVRIDGIEGCSASLARGLMSENAYRALLRDIIGQYSVLLEGFPEATAIVPLYRPADGIAAGEGATAKIWRRLQKIQPGLHAPLGLFYDLIEEQVAGMGMSLIRQPAETVSQTGFTRAEFGEGGRQLPWKGGEPKPADDRVHLNADFGAIVWERIFERIGEPAAARRAG